MDSSFAHLSQLDLSDPRILKGAAPFDISPSPPAGVTSLPQLFQHQARSQPDHIAFSCQTDHGLEQVTYAEADRIARALAAQILLLRPHPSPNDAQAPVVAIWLEKGLHLILSILATTCAGATWLPLDPDVPVQRAATCILDASAIAIICDAAHEDRAHEVLVQVRQASVATGKDELQIRTYDELSGDIQHDASPTTIPKPHASGPRPQDAAYLIYTSGTTGTPKGIAIPHSAALTFSLSEREVLETSSDDVVWNGFSPAFDMFIEEMWVTIAGGGHLAIGTREECRDVPTLPGVWRERGVSVVNAVPTLISIMDIAQGDDRDSLLPPCVRLINLGGEACPPALVSRLARPGLRIVNTYGPTETTVTATWDELQPDLDVTIGRPLPSYHACLLPIPDDDSQTPLTPLDLTDNIEGELAIGGPCVGLGYIGREALTAQKFIPHPLSCGERLYRAGDRVRLRPDGKLLFLGRIDTQVKHRGFRIELGEIEAVLTGCDGVQTAAVILTDADEGTGAGRLEAFLVVRAGVERDGEAMHGLLGQRLPAYMQVDKIFFVEADEMPRLPSGKINGKGLHELSKQKTAASAASTPAKGDYSEEDSAVDDTSALGLLLATLTSLFPHTSHITPQTDFFDHLGGHSLLAAVLVSRLRQVRSELDGSMPFASIGLSDIYEGRTPAAITARFTIWDESEASSLDDLKELHDDEGTGPQTGTHWPVSQRNFVVCGLAQLVPLFFLFFIYSIDILVPYLVFDLLVRHANIGWAVLAAYGVFVLTPVGMAVMAVAGKWLILGKAKPGEYPLYGLYYFRWWTAERLASLANAKLVADSALYPYFLRAMGAKVGKYCHIGALAVGACCDLVEIGDDVVIGADVVLAVSVVERGRLIIKKITILDDAIIGSHCVIEGRAIVGQAAEVGPLSVVPDGMYVPDLQRFHGSPAQFDCEVKEGQAALGRHSRPSATRAWAMLLGNGVIATLVMPLLYFVPQVPGLMLFDVVDLRHIGNWSQVAILSVPIAFGYQLLIFAQLILLRYLVLGRLRESKYKIYSTWYLRKWFVERLMDLALDVLHPVFASLYIVPFLRLLGVKAGERAEISTARGLSFELLEIGKESFVADAVMLGDSDVRGNELTLKKTKLEARAFAGNASLLPQGTTLASGTLLGVLSIAPPADKPMPAGTSCFGSPPILMPARHRSEGHKDELLFHPSRGRVAARFFIEGLRIVLPRALIIFGLGLALQIAYAGYASIGAVYTLLLLPAFYFFMFALPSLLLTAILKWTLIGRYKTAEWPLWSLNVWLSEAVTSTWETVTEPLLASLLVGTPYLAWCFRLMGVKIGSRVTLLSSDITEFDCVTIGDEAMINQRCGAQTHLFEDRVMKVGEVTLGSRACVKPYSICLPGSSVSDGAQLGSLSLVMKVENLPAGTAWEGAPVVPRARRKRTLQTRIWQPSTEHFSGSDESSRKSRSEASCSKSSAGVASTGTDTPVTSRSRG